MAIRFADILSKNTGTHLDGRQDFVVRTRRPVWQTLLIMFASILPISVFLGIMVKDLIVFSQILFVLLGALGTYVVYTVQRARDLVLATEFQNAIFASALGHNNEICIIIKNDGTIFYIGKILQAMLPGLLKEARKDVGIILEQGQVSKEEQKIVFNAIERYARGQVVFDLTDSKKQKHRIMMSFEPIARPKGYMLLRGREFVEKRVLGPEIPVGEKTPVFNKNNLGLFSYITDSMDIGAYIIDLFGNITYANITLEQWLDFDEDEMVEHGLSLKDIISQNGLNISVAELKNFDGEVNLQRKIGGHVKASVEQKAMYDEKGTIIGYAAFLHQIKEHSTGDHLNRTQKDSW
jgi:PAS domain-containing protein